MGSIPAAVRALYEAGLSRMQTQHGYVGHSDTEWVVKMDGSVHGGGELVSPPLNFDNPDHRAQVDTAVKALRSTGARTGEAAGIHIHIDASDLSAEQVACVARTFVKFEDILYRLASSGWRSMRPGAASFCRPLTSSQVAGLSRAKSKAQVYNAYFDRSISSQEAENIRVSHSDSARYCGLNLQSWFYRGTIEFRIFNSSLNAERIQAYIAVCMALVEDARRGKKRSVNKAYRLGGMRAGTTNADAAYHRFQQVVRYDAGMEMADYKLMNKCWKDSLPQTASLGR